MATKPELNIAEYGKDISSVQYNDNFNKLNNYIEAISEELILKVNTINSQLSSNVLSNLQSIYSVGSLYIGATDTCPIANLFGTWEKVAEGLVTGLDKDIQIKGNGNVLGLTDGLNIAYLGQQPTEYEAGLQPFKNGGQLGTAVSGGLSTRGVYYGIATDPVKSGIAGTANVTKLEVNIWKRTA